MYRKTVIKVLKLAVVYYAVLIYLRTHPPWQNFFPPKLVANFIAEKNFSEQILLLLGILFSTRHVGGGTRWKTKVCFI